MFGRFVPDFGRVVAQMQFDMYHHYTVDEHSIRAIGLLVADRARRAQGRPSARHRPVPADRLAPGALCRGAAPRHRQGPRRRPQRARRRGRAARSARGSASSDGRDRDRRLAGALAPADVGDRVQARPRRSPRRSHDFVERVKSLERLRLLLHAHRRRHPRGRARASGTAGSASCCATCSTPAEEMLRLGHKQKGRRERIAAIQEELAARLGWEESRFARLAWRLPDSYWLAEPIDVLERNARLIDAADRAPDRRQAGRDLDPGGARRDPGHRLRQGPAGPVLPDRRRDQPGRRQHHRRAHPHHRRRHGARQFPGPGRRRRGPFADRHQLEAARGGGAAARSTGRSRRRDRLAARALPLRRAEAFADPAGGVRR